MQKQPQQQKTQNKLDMEVNSWSDIIVRQTYNLYKQILWKR